LVVATLSSPGEHQLLVFWVQLAVLVRTARLLGGLMRRIGPPAVIGELAAGLLVLGADPRQLDDRAFLGHTVEEVLARCAATVVVTVPPESGGPA
jgi:Kef-type K+ transport system membrane component KefB